MATHTLNTTVERYFEDFAVGDAVKSAGLTLTESMIIDYALTYDPQPFHIDKASAQDSIFGELIASGLQTMAFCLRLFLDTGVFKACSQGGTNMNVRWSKPVFPGDTISVHSVITAKRESQTRNDIGYLTVRHETVNQHGKPVMQIDSDHIVKRHTPKS